MTAQPFAQHDPGLHAILVELAFEPHKQRPVRLWLGAQQVVVLMGQCFHEIHMVQQQPGGLV